MEIIRENTRELGRQHRMKHREFAFNQGRRSLGDFTVADKLISPHEVKEIAVLIKKKSNASSEQLSILQQAFIQNEDNIDAFLKVPGALNVLIKELSGQDAILQLAAAHCCCNLALGKSQLCCQVSKAAASYLTLHLQGANTTLVDICAWTLGNLSSSGSTSWDILNNQGAGLKLAHLLKSENPAVVYSAIYALAHYVKAGDDKLSAQELNLICTNACPLITIHSEVYWLIYLLSCQAICDEILLANNVMQFSVKHIYELVTKETFDVDQVTALLRVIGNLSSGDNGIAAQTVLDCPVDAANFFSALLLLKHQHLKNETLWVLGNLSHHSSFEIRQLFALSGILTSLSSVLNFPLL